MLNFSKTMENFGKAWNIAIPPNPPIPNASIDSL